jgi:hypothetical protein
MAGVIDVQKDAPTVLRSGFEIKIVSVFGLSVGIQEQPNFRAILSSKQEPFLEP